MSIDIIAPNLADTPPIRCGPGCMLELQRSGGNTFNAGDVVTFELIYQPAGPAYDMADGRFNVLVTGTGVVLITMQPSSLRLRGVANGAALKAQAVVSRPGVGIIESTSYNTQFVWDPDSHLSGLLTDPSGLVAQILAAVQHNYPTTA